jgi:hypothetical protein
MFSVPSDTMIEKLQNIENNILQPSYQSRKMEENSTSGISDMGGKEKNAYAKC